MIVYQHEAGRKVPWGYIRPFSPIELACAVGQSGPCVRAFCESGVLFHMSNLKLHFALHNSHCTLRAPNFISQCTLKTPHFTLHTSHVGLHSPHFTFFIVFSTPHFALHSTLHTSLCTLHSSCPRFHTALFTLHTSSHPTLHLIWILLTSRLFSSHLIPSNMSSKLSWITSQFHFENLHAPCASHVRACVLCAKLLRRCCPRTWPHTSDCIFTLHTCTSHLHFALDESSHLNHLTSFHLVPSLLTCNPNKFFSTVFISSEHWSTFLISVKFSTHSTCSARQKGFIVRAKFLAQKKT